MSERIRAGRADDAPALAAIYDPIVAHTAISFEETPPGPIGMAQRIAAAGQWFPWLVFERDTDVLGYAYGSQHRSRAAYRWSVDVSVYVADRGRRMGIARRLYAQLFELLERQGYRAAFAGVALPNEASCNLHQSVGFTPVGVYHAVGYKAGAWHDVMWFERPLRLPTQPPGELLPLTALPAAPG